MQMDRLKEGGGKKGGEEGGRKEQIEDYGFSVWSLGPMALSLWYGRAPGLEYMVERDPLTPSPGIKGRRAWSWAPFKDKASDCLFAPMS